MGSYYVVAVRVSVWDDENTLDMDGGNGCTKCECTEHHSIVHLKW